MASVPTTIGRYTVQRVLGRGGMGTVYLATDPLIDRDVAIKVLPPAGDDQHAQRLLAEARVSGRLVHPHVVGVYDIGEEQGQPFVVMPYIPGRTLASILGDADRPPLAVKLRWMRELCDALAYAHERRVIHRDIKPGNLLIDERGALRVLDFGIAKVLTTSQIKFTSVGTPAYMAPEQYSTDPVDPRTDIFSAGLVLFELITHRRALSGESPAQIYGQLMAGRLPRLADAVPDVDPTLAAVCDRAIARHPADRFQTALAFGEALAAVAVAPPAPPAPVPLVEATAPTVVAHHPESTLPLEPPAPDPPVSTAFVPPPVPPVHPPAPPRADPPAHEDGSALEPGERAWSWPPQAWQWPSQPPVWIAATAVAVGVALLGLLAWGGRSSGAVDVAPPEDIVVFDPTPAPRHRTAAWIRGFQGENCAAATRDNLGVFGDPFIAFHFTPTRCTADGLPDLESRALFRETEIDIGKIWERFPEGGQVERFVPSRDGRVVVVVGRNRWMFVSSDGGAVLADVTPAPGALQALSDDGRTVLYTGQGRLGIHRAGSSSASFPVTTDGQTPTAPLVPLDIDASGRFVLFESAATNLVSNPPAGGITPGLYRYDVVAQKLRVVASQLGDAQHGLAHRASIGSGGDWIAYTSWRSDPRVFPTPEPGSSLALYAFQASTGRTVFVDSVRLPTGPYDSRLEPVAIIEGNLLVYLRDLGAAASAREYVWIALPEGRRERMTATKTQLIQANRPPARVAPGCLGWLGDSAWCIDP